MPKPTAIVTSGPTREKIDPVRFISNFSSGKQGHAVACALRDAGFDVTFVSGPVNMQPPERVKVINIETANEMLEACISLLPMDVAVCTAAVCDFKPVEYSTQKLKKQSGVLESTIKLIQNPDILKTISNHPLRPKVVVGFAAETENLLENARNKLTAKNCNIIVANDVSNGQIFGNDKTSVNIISRHLVEHLDNTDKITVAKELTIAIINMLENKNI